MEVGAGNEEDGRLASGVEESHEAGEGCAAMPAACRRRGTS